VAFPPESVITENRLDEAAFLGDSTIEYVIYDRPDLEKILDSEQYFSPRAAVAAWFTLFFPGLNQPTDVSDMAWRSVLGGLLKKHLLFVNLLKLLKAASSP